MVCSLPYFRRLIAKSPGHSKNVSNYLGAVKNFRFRRWLRPSPLTVDAGCYAGDVDVGVEVVVV